MRRDHLRAAAVDSSLELCEHGVLGEVGEEAGDVAAVPGLHPGRDVAHRLDRLFHAITILRFVCHHFRRAGRRALTFRARLLDVSAVAL
jgi:hypothetical protein